MTDADDRALLLKIARDAVTAYVNHKGGPAPHAGISVDLASRRGGAFVTIHHRGQLRGCIGHIEGDRRLVGVVAECAASACSVDPRFPPVAADELADIDVELSLLGPLEPILGPDDIEIGKHGLLVARDGRRGLLLPQVATEWQWDATTFLAHTCRKAGLPVDAWKRDAELWRFEAEVFSEAAGPATAR